MRQLLVAMALSSCGSGLQHWRPPAWLQNRLQYAHETACLCCCRTARLSGLAARCARHQLPPAVRRSKVAEPHCTVSVGGPSLTTADTHCVHGMKCDCHLLRPPGRSDWHSKCAHGAVKYLHSTAASVCSPCSRHDCSRAFSLCSSCPSSQISSNSACRCRCQLSQDEGHAKISSADCCVGKHVSQQHLYNSMSGPRSCLPWR